MDGEDRENRDNAPPDGTDTPPPVYPWRDIFFRPRATTRWLLANETAGSAQWLWLSSTALFIVMMFLALTFYPGNFDRAAMKMRLVVFTPVIFLVSWGYFIVQSYLLCLLSRLMGGRCTVDEMRVVNAYTTVIPSLVFGLVRLGLMMVIGREGVLMSLVNNALLVWTFYIALGGIAAAAQIVSWRALVVYLATLLIWIAAAAAAMGIIEVAGGLLPGL